MILMVVLSQQRIILLLILLKQMLSFLLVCITVIMKFIFMLIKQRLAILGSGSKDFIKDEMSKISLNGFDYDFSFDHSAIEKQGTVNIH